MSTPYPQQPAAQPAYQGVPQAGVPAQPTVPAPPAPHGHSTAPPGCAPRSVVAVKRARMRAGMGLGCGACSAISRADSPLCSAGGVIPMRVWTRRIWTDIPTPLCGLRPWPPRPCAPNSYQDTLRGVRPRVPGVRFQRVPALGWQGVCTSSVGLTCGLPVRASRVGCLRG